MGSIPWMRIQLEGGPGFGMQLCGLFLVLMLVFTKPSVLFSFIEILLLFISAQVFANVHT